MKPEKSKVIKSLLENAGIVEFDENTIRILEEFQQASILINRTYRVMGKLRVIKISDASTSQIPTLVHGIISTNQVQISTGLD